MNQTVCYVCFSYNIKFNVAASFWWEKVLKTLLKFYTELFNAISFSIWTAKSQELKKDIEILSQTFERVIDRKEAIIKSLVKDIEEAEEQYQMALRSHLQNVDRLIGMYSFKDRL